jgi:predicted HAD superfamily Cof-like phosphohydrolase
MTTDLRDNVKAFHDAMGMKDPARPAVPSDDIVRLRARLITEEYFETIRALFRDESGWLHQAEQLAGESIKHDHVRVDLPEFVDGLADLMYVAEGSFLAFGIDSAPVHAEVQRSNMAKVGGPTREDGKCMKPPGWTPPDIAGVIEAQS